jgi:hypothetical protein
MLEHLILLKKHVDGVEYDLNASKLQFFLPLVLGAQAASSLWLGLLAWWQDSPNEVSFCKPW